MSTFQVVIVSIVASLVATLVGAIVQWLVFLWVRRHRQNGDCNGETNQ